MIVKDFDLYFNGSLLIFPNGEEMMVRDLIDYQTKEPDAYHTVKDGDTLTQIAFNYYKNLTDNSPKYWKYIADVNKIFNPLDLTALVGQDITIPNFRLIKLAE